MCALKLVYTAAQLNINIYQNKIFKQTLKAATAAAPSSKSKYQRVSIKISFPSSSLSSLSIYYQSKEVNWIESPLGSSHPNMPLLAWKLLHNVRSLGRPGRGGSDVKQSNKRRKISINDKKSDIVMLFG